MKNNCILTIEAPDAKGLVALVTTHIAENGGNIVQLAQYTNPKRKRFYMRVEWELKDYKIAKKDISKAFLPVARKKQLGYQIHFSDEPMRIGILVSKYDHCLFDLLLRKRSGEINGDIPVIISNHKELEGIASMFKVPFHYVPTIKNKAQQEKEIIKILRSYKVDLVVFARYMQIVSDKFIAEFPSQVINVHHSFLPAFSGAKPYHQAFDRGVKIIGATSHFVTKDLDAGPIIDQATTKITHEDNVEDLISKGRDLERTVLASAVQLFTQHRLFIDGNRTIIL